MLDIIRREGYRLVERPFTVAEAKRGARGLPYQHHRRPAAGRADRRRTGRRGQAWPARPKAARGLCRARRGCRVSGLSLIPDAAAPLRRPRAVLFDWDNTLVDSWATIHEALNFLMRAMGKPEWSLAETQAAGAAQPARGLSAAFSASAGRRRGEIYLDRFREIHLDRLTALPGRESDAAGACRAGDVSRAWSATRPANCCGARSPGSAGRSFSAASSGQGMRWSTSRPASRSIWRWRQAACRPARRYGLSVTPRSTWNAPETAAASRCCSAMPPRRRSSPRFAPHLSFADESGLFHLLEGLRFGAPRPSS